MGPARSTKRVSLDDDLTADRTETAKATARREAANDDKTNVLRQARRMRDEWRRNRYTRLKPA